MDLGKVILERRKKLGVSQEDVAAFSGVSRRFITAIENGKLSVSLEKVIAVTKALGLDLRFEISKER
jgi:HTH-type transcriptional regulator/antitoxin HipB